MGHQDPAVDALQRDVEQFVSARAGAPRAEVFAAVCDLV